MTTVDIENQAELDGSAISRAAEYRLNRPRTRSRAPLKPVPQHLRKRRDRRPLPQLMPAPCIEPVQLPNWLAAFLDRNAP